VKKIKVINSIALGNFSGITNQHSNSICINATGLNFITSETGLFINPINSENTTDLNKDKLLFYDDITHQIKYYKYLNK
jgi:hypothetical protein